MEYSFFHLIINNWKQRLYFKLNGKIEGKDRKKNILDNFNFVCSGEFISKVHMDSMYYICIAHGRNHLIMALNREWWNYIKILYIGYP